MIPLHPSLSWLLEKNNPTVRYLALRDLMHTSSTDSEYMEAKKEAYDCGPINDVLRHMNPKGYWVKPGAGYNPKYTSTVWSLMLLSQLGASALDDPRIENACRYYLDQAFTTTHALSYNGAPHGTISCLEGNMTLALTLLGCSDDRVLETAEWMARSVLGDGVTYYTYTCGPHFVCGANGKKPCAWGAVKVLLALSRIPKNKRSRRMNDALEKGVDFLLGIDPLEARYPTRTNTPPSRDWWKFGFPVFYVTDLLQLAEAVARAGHGNDPRIQKTRSYIESKQNSQGQWNLDYGYAGKIWGDYGEKGKPNKWVTYRALCTLQVMGSH